MNYFSGVDIVDLVIHDSYQTNDLIEAEDHEPADRQSANVLSINALRHIQTRVFHY